MTTAWTNWAGNQRCVPASVAHLASIDELTQVVATAAAAGHRVKPVGASHSFTAIAATEGVQIRLDRLTGLIDADTATGLVTLQAGTPLRDVPALLAPYGLAMTNLGDIDCQSISGAISTGTHGTGGRVGGIATQVRELSVVLADGSIATCSAGERPDLFAAARVGLGALGVLATVTLQCEPVFLLSVEERPVRFTEMVDRFDERDAAVDHVGYFWFPDTGRALSKESTRLPGGAAPAPLGRIKSYVDDELLANTVYGLTCRIGHHVPRLIPPLNAIAARALGTRAYTDWPHRVFPSSRRVRFCEMEYAIPRESLAEVLEQVRRLIERRRWRISFPVEVRTAAADDIWLSTAYGRDSAYVAVHQYYRTPHEEYFRAAEEIFSAVGGRPHWGKLHYLSAADLAGRYPHFDDFVRVRNEVDPDRRFANPYLDRVLGA